MSGRERVERALAGRGSGGLPRGELFLLQDFLDDRFPATQGDYVRQLDLAGELLGLSAIGADLNRSESGLLLAEGKYRALSRYFVIGCVNGPVSRVVERLGFAKAMVEMRKEKDRFIDCAREANLQIEDMCLHARANGISAIAVADDIAGNGGLLFSVKDFASMVMPLYEEIGAIIKGHGLFAFFHCDGNTLQIIDSLIGAGYDCIHPVDSQAGMDIRVLRKTYGSRVSFMGHIDALAWDATRTGQEIETGERDFGAGELILGTSGGISAGSVTPGLSVLYPRLGLAPANHGEAN